MTTTPTRKNSAKKRVFTLFIALLLCFALALPCFAWESPPDYPLANSQGYSIKQYGYALYENDPDKIAWVFLEYRLPDGNGGYTFSYMYFVDPFVMAEWVNAYIEANDTIPSAADDIPALYRATLTQVAPSGIWSVDVLNEQIDRTYLSALPLALYAEQDGYDRGLEEGKTMSYNQGYTDGTKEADVAENYLLTLFSAPAYILSTIFSFEILGLNVYALIAFLITLAVIGFVLKKLL